MLNEEKVLLMTKMASYEEQEGKKNVAIGSYFRGDYISLQVIKSIIYATLAYGVALGIFIFYDFEGFMQNIYKMDLLGFGKSVIFSYLAVIGVYAMISYMVYSYRYNKAKKSLKCYYNNLKKLSMHYEEESKREGQKPKGNVL